MSARNVDPAEIGRFAQLAGRWWDPDGEMAALHHINPLRTRLIREAAGGLQGKRAVDIGCGAGLLSEALAREGAEVTGIDLAEASLEAARLHARQSGLEIDYRAMAAEQLAAEQAGYYDLVCCLEMLEHVPDPASVVQACAALVKPGGTLVFSTLNRHPKAFALAIVGAEYLLGLIPRGTHDYAKFIRPSELLAWCQHNGLEAVATRGLHYNPLLKSARLNDNVDVNYFLICRRPA
jgi:2-polyprenyl-6-hydroxyphenyl methylase / 3-demethylubiquinone-9 3-methyltransferase